MLRLMHTPDGVRDIYGEEEKAKRSLMKKVAGIFEAYSYDHIETPTFEYFDVFSNEIGTTPSNELYKFFDRDGNTLVLRPDFTPSVARAAAMYMEEEERPLRLCYSGNTYVNTTEYQGRLKESTQMGVELIGENSSQADAEIIALTIEALKKAGLKEFQVSIGEVEFFKSLVKNAGLDEETEKAVRRLISSKNFFGVQEVLDKTGLSEKKKKAFVMMPQLFGGPEVLTKARGLALTKSSAAAIDRLEDIYHILDQKGLTRYVSFDFGALSKYRYYTGIIFSAFTYGSGEPVAKGGRYDNLLGHFGKDEAAVGVGIYVDQLLTSLRRTGRRAKK